MDLALSEEQEILRKTARSFLTDKCNKTLVREMEKDARGYSPELWREMAELGWMGLVFLPEYGGGGMNFLDLSVLLEEMGRVCLPSPFFPTIVLGGLTILEAGSKEQKMEYLPKIASGDAIFTVALTEPSARFDAESITTEATTDDGGYIINGKKFFVPDAHIADYLLCIARTNQSVRAEEGITIFIVDAKTPGVSLTALITISGEKLHEVVFDRVRVGRGNILGKVDRGWPFILKLMERAAVAKCCEMLGGSQQILEKTVDYAKERIQFERPIGAFQSIQHHCANMATDIMAARFSVYLAAWMISEGFDCTREVAIAKAWMNQASGRVINLGHQVHGTISLTIDHDLHFYNTRIKAAQVSWGDTSYYHNIIAQETRLFDNICCAPF